VKFAPPCPDRSKGLLFSGPFCFQPQGENMNSGYENAALRVQDAFKTLIDLLEK
jgi:hypothetical protein